MQIDTSKLIGGGGIIGNGLTPVTGGPSPSGGMQNLMTPMASTLEPFDTLNLDISADMTGSVMLTEYQREISRLRQQNNHLLMIREARESEYENVMFEN